MKEAGVRYRGNEVPKALINSRIATDTCLVCSSDIQHNAATLIHHASLIVS